MGARKRKTGNILLCIFLHIFRMESRRKIVTPSINPFLFRNSDLSKIRTNNIIYSRWNWCIHATFFRKESGTPPQADEPFAQKKLCRNRNAHHTSPTAQALDFSLERNFSLHALSIRLKSKRTIVRPSRLPTISALEKRSGPFGTAQGAYSTL